MKNPNSKAKLILSIIAAIPLMFFLLKIETPEIQSGIIILFINGSGRVLKRIN